MGLLREVGAFATFLFCSLGLISSVVGESFPLPALRSDSVIGGVGMVAVEREETLVDIARRHDLGFDQIVAANPGISPWGPRPGSRVLIPSQYVLPPGERKGIVLNLAELRMYYYPSNAGEVLTFPVSIGRMDWRTPLGRTRIISKDRNPAWSPPLSIRQEHLADGEFLPDVVRGGADDNPLGKFALRLGIPGYFIHGTDEAKSFGIGMRVTHGCVRMYPEDIEELFGRVSIGTPVSILHAPVKVGALYGRVFLEVHRPQDDDEAEVFEMPSLSDVIQMVQNALPSGSELSLPEIIKIYEQGTGLPVPLSY
jgi:L,D-transpeptidase ErfK/SrfK